MENTDRNETVLRKISEAFLGSFSSIYYVDAETNEYQWYSVSDDFRSLRIEQSGDDFFANMARDARKVICPEDQHLFTEDLDREALLNAEGKEFIYRLMIDGRPTYHSMRVIRGGQQEGAGFFILTVQNIDAEYREKLERDRLAKERHLFNQVARSLARVYDSIYYVNIQTDNYTEFASSNLLEALDKPEENGNFFEKLKSDAERIVWDEDRERVIAFLDKETLLGNLHSQSMISMEYRLQIGTDPVYVRLSGMLADDGVHIILCVENIDRHIRALSEARDQAMKDSLTGIRNKKAYFELENSIQNSIDNGILHPFAIAICDINDLKKTNDEQGHAAGDELIRNACRLICDTFKHSPVFRIGGDEFAVVLNGQDYEHRTMLCELLRDKAVFRMKNRSGAVVACGIATFDAHKDHGVADVFKRADDLMYKNKKALKTNA